jgi:hypothetical protein
VPFSPPIARRSMAVAAGVLVLVSTAILTTPVAQAHRARAHAPAHVVAGHATPDLIRRDVAAGRISATQGARYLSWAFTAPDRIPAAYRSTAPWDGTAALLQLRQLLPTLPSGPLARQVRGDVGRLATFPCRDASSPLPNRATTKHFFLEFNHTMLKGLGVGGYTSALEKTWSTEVGAFHWPAPPRDPAVAVPGGKYLVRIQRLGPGLYGYVTGTHFVGNNTATPWNDRDAYASCMVLNQNMEQFGGKPLASMRATVAHEFNHSLQFGMGALTGPTNVKGVWVEGGATWMEDEVFTGSNDNYNYIGTNLPDLRTPMPLYNPSFPYPYWLVFRAMTEQFGGTGTAGGGQRIMRFFWEELSKNAATNTNAFKAAFKSVHSTLAVAYHDAGIALRFDEPCNGQTVRPYCLKEGPAYQSRGFGGADNRNVTVASPITGNLANDFTTLWVGLPTHVPPYPVSLNVTSGTGWLKTSAVCRTGPKLKIYPLGTAAAATHIAYPTFDPTGCDEVTLVISNVRETGPSPTHKTLTGYSLALT